MNSHFAICAQMYHEKIIKIRLRDNWWWNLIPQEEILYTCIPKQDYPMLSSRVCWHNTF